MLPWLSGAAALVSGTALWLSLGALTLSHTNPAPDRIGVLPDPLWWFVCVSLAVLAVRVVSVRVVWLLLGSALAWLPWLPGRVPAVAYMWLGPVLALVATVGVVVAVGLSQHPWHSGVRLWFINERRATLLAFLAAAAVYATGPFQLDDYTPGGDEPHYLIITQSLLRDGDLRIENNHRDGDYWEYFSGELRPDFLRRGVDGEIYSVHAPGLSALVAPAYALGGYTGVTIFLVLLSALGASLAWRLGYRVTGRADAAWFGWAAVAWSAPWVFHAFTVYPDGPAAVIALVGVWAIVDDEGTTPRRRILQGAAVALLPWMHTRYAVLAAAFGLIIVMRDRRRTRGATLVAAFMAVPLASAAAWFAFFRIIYGTFDPAEPYGGWSRTGASLATLVRGFPALLFDQQFGLIANAPVLLCGLGGLWVLWRRMASRRLACELAAIIVPYSLQATSYPMWWGGYSAPARFLAPIILVLAVPAAAMWSEARYRTTRVFALAALGVSWFITAAMLLVGPGRLVYNSRDGFALWLEWMSPLADLNAALPSFHRHRFEVAVMHVGIWCLALTVGWAFARLVTGEVGRVGPALTAEPAHGPPVDEAGRSDVAALLVLALAVSVAVDGVWRQTGSSGEGVTSAQAWVLRTASSRPDLMSVRYAGGRVWPRVAPLDAGLSHLRLTSNRRRAPSPTPVLLVRELPAGRYLLHVPVKSGAQGEIRASIGRTSMLVDRWPLGLGAATREFQREIDLPVPIHSLTVTADETARDGVGQGWLEPVHMGSALSGSYDDQALRATRYDEAVVYFPSDDAFMEPTGFWLRPEVPTVVVWQGPARPDHARVFLRNGPVANSVTLALGDWRATESLQPNEEREIETTAATGASLIFRARATAGFRPSEVDKSSTDVRNLSCWVEFR